MSSALNTVLPAAQAGAIDGSEKEAATHIVLVKGSLIDATNHGGWPFRIGKLRDTKRKGNLVAGLRALENLTQAPVVTYARIWPPLLDRDEATVNAALESPKARDGFLYERAAKSVPRIRAHFEEMSAAGK